ncbi:GFA family protein [Geminicoccus harenae]|uniref:GFA family protein n=1 Tax=Geminicoccus harenae TaxID=2498453 RepID=UPI00168B0962|nr:GFA family protein [Geminicoccus harenae]
MPLTLNGSCRCGAVRFTCQSHTPVPYQRCYCTICRKTAGGGGYAVNLGADADSFRIDDPHDAVEMYQAQIVQDDGTCELSTAERNFCAGCGTALWLFSPEWPELVHPFAAAIDSELPRPKALVHMMLRFKPDWVVPEIGKADQQFELYPELSLADWHKRHGQWVD